MTQPSLPNACLLLQTKDWLSPLSLVGPRRGQEKAGRVIATGLLKYSCGRGAVSAVAWLLALANPVHLGPTDRASAARGRLTVLHRDSLRVLHFTLSSALQTKGLHRA